MIQIDFNNLQNSVIAVFLPKCARFTALPSSLPVYRGGKSARLKCLPWSRASDSEQFDLLSRKE
jgi:hypothetical protein